jgi:CsbD-like
VLFLSKSFSTSAEGKAAQEREQQNMNWDQVAGKWKEVKGKAREKWGKLTDDDLDVIAGRREQLGWTPARAVRRGARGG